MSQHLCYVSQKRSFPVEVSLSCLSAPEYVGRQQLVGGELCSFTTDSATQPAATARDFLGPLERQGLAGAAAAELASHVAHVEEAVGVASSP